MTKSHKAATRYFGNVHLIAAARDACGAQIENVAADGCIVPEIEIGKTTLDICAAVVYKTYRLIN